jgi:DNA replication protein DnaC
MPQEKAKKHNLTAVPKPASSRQMTEFAGDSDVCQKCFGTGMEVVEGKGARICSCRKLRSERGQFEGFGLPNRYKGFHFHNYKPQSASQEVAQEFALKLTTEYPAVERGLLFMGSVGVGKTHLAVSILKGLTERGFSCRFCDFGSLLKEIQDSYNTNTQTSELGVLAPVLNAEVLVLDELGSSKPTDWVRDTMAHIINTRYNSKKLTIFTTNYADERPGDGKEILEDRIGVRLRSRLYEMCKTVTMDGKDYRRNFDRSLAAKKST